MDRLAGFCNGKFAFARVHIRGQDVDAHPPRFAGQNPDLVDIARFCGQQGGHVFDGIVRLEEGGLARQHRIVRCVRLVKAIAREEFHVVEEFVGDLAIDNPGFFCALDKLVVLLEELLLVLFADRLAQQVGLRRRITGHAHRHLHDLFLIHAVVNNDVVSDKVVQSLDGHVVNVFDAGGCNTYNLFPAHAQNYDVSANRDVRPAVQRRCLKSARGAAPGDQNAVDQCQIRLQPRLDTGVAFSTSATKGMPHGSFFSATHRAVSAFLSHQKGLDPFCEARRVEDGDLVAGSGSAGAFIRCCIDRCRDA